MSEESNEVYRSYGKEFRFNDTVKCVTLSLWKQKPIIGRLVQVRIKCGQFGSDIYFLRMDGGGLETFENEMIEHVVADIPKGPDSITDTYSIKGDWEETGFIVEKPKQPETPGSFSIAICSPTQPPPI